MNSEHSIRFHYVDQHFYFPDRSKLKAALHSLIQAEGKELDAINVVFCDDAYLLNLNQDYLKHDTYTDIITFELSARGLPLLADIFISIPRVKANASELKLSFKEELHRVIFHGFLHLAGYKDKTLKEQTIMRTKESQCLRSYFVPRGTSKSF